MTRHDTVNSPQISEIAESDKMARDAGREDASRGRSSKPPSKPFDIEAYILGYYGYRLNI